MANEVMIIVKAKNDTKAVFAAIRKEARELGDDMGVDVTARFTQRINREAQNAAGAWGKAGDTIGETISEHISDKITERIKVDVNERLRDSRGRLISGSSSDSSSSSRSDNGGNGRDRDRVHVTVDVDKKSIMERIGDVVDNVESRLRGGLTAAFSTFFSGDFLTLILKAVGGGVLGAGLTSVLAAALSSAVLVAFGGGAIAAGIVGAFQNPRIMTAATAAKNRLKAIFDDFSSNFLGPVEDFFAPSNGGNGGLAGVLNQIEPIIHSLGQEMGQVAGKLGDGIIGFLQNVMPSILRAVDASVPLINVLADELPGIGEAMGDFFDSISQGSPSATVFFKDFLNLVQLIIKALGRLVLGFTNMYGIFRTGFLQLSVLAAEWASGFVEMARIALGWIPGIGGKLDHAQAAIKKFKDKANATLNQIKDVDVTVKIRTVGIDTARNLLDIARTLRGMGYAHGGIVGQAASGGPRSGLTWVGEHGPELIDAAPGSRVHSNPDSMRMMQQSSGGGQPLLVQLLLDGRVLAEQLLDPTRQMVDRRFGGSVQAAYGRAF